MQENTCLGNNCSLSMVGIIKLRKAFVDEFNLRLLPAILVSQMLANMFQYRTAGYL